MMAFVKSLNSGLKPVIVNLIDSVLPCVLAYVFHLGGEATRRLRASIQ